MNVADICTREIVMADTRASLEEAAVGIVTDRDLRCEISHGTFSRTVALPKLEKSKRHTITIS